MTKYDYDIICIGSGSAGGAAAFCRRFGFSNRGYRLTITEVLDNL